MFANQLYCQYKKLLFHSDIWNDLNLPFDSNINKNNFRREKCKISKDVIGVAARNKFLWCLVPLHFHAAIYEISMPYKDIITAVCLPLSFVF